MDKFLEKSAEWLFGQGVSTVLLFAGLFTAWKLLPYLARLSEAINGLEGIIAKSIEEQKINQSDTKERFSRLDAETKDNFKTLIGAVNSLLKEIAVLLARLDGWDNEARESRKKASAAYYEIKGMVQDMPKTFEDNVNSKFGEIQRQLEDKMK